MTVTGAFWLLNVPQVWPSARRELAGGSAAYPSQRTSSWNGHRIYLRSAWPPCAASLFRQPFLPSVVWQFADIGLLTASLVRLSFLKNRLWPIPLIALGLSFSESLGDPVFAVAVLATTIPAISSSAPYRTRFIWPGLIAAVALCFKFSLLIVFAGSLGLIALSLVVRRQFLGLPYLALAYIGPFLFIWVLHGQSFSTIDDFILNFSGVAKSYATDMQLVGTEIHITRAVWISAIMVVSLSIQVVFSAQRCHTIQIGMFAICIFMFWKAGSHGTMDTKSCSR